MLVLALATGVLVSVSQTQGIGTVSAASAHARPGSTPDAGHPNRFDPHTHTTSISHTPSSTASGSTSAVMPKLPRGTLAQHTPLPMQPGQIALQPGKAAHYIGSDGRLIVDVPAGAVTATDVAQAGGALFLQVRQVAQTSGSSAGGSGEVSLGTYLLQVVDAHAVLATQGLHQPVTLHFDYGTKGSALDLAHVIAVFNAPLPDGASGAPLAATSGVTSTPASGISSGGLRSMAYVGVSATALGLGRPSHTPMTLDRAHHQLQASTTFVSASASASFNTDAPVASFGKPDPFNVDLNAGALTFDEPIDLPNGPGGLTPPLHLTYSSAGVSEQHNIEAAAPWVGEGWNLSLGSISWAEHNVTSYCPSGCGATWESSWQLSDPFGTAAELIPPNTGVSTYYDDTPNTYYNTSTKSYPNTPVRWHTAPETHAKIYSYVGPNSLPNMPAHPSCFRVYLPNGIMEEFGCTPDSLQYYYVPSNLDSYYVSSWLLDLITDPNGNQIHITYQRDMATYSGASYTRDVEPATVEWDSPGCHDVQHACTGSAWAPLMRVNFVASHSVARLTGHPNSNPCNTGSNLRCDDPLDYSGSGGLAAPQVQSTFVLNDIQVQLRSSGTGNWNTLKDYQLSYEQSGPHFITDPVSGLQMGFAGTLDMTQIQMVGDDGNTTLPADTFGYTWGTQHYVDMLFHAAPSDNCGVGFSWNSVNCWLWGRSLDGNSRYISSASNGLGLAQTFSWAEGRSNTHGVPTGQDPTDTLYCDGVSSDTQKNYPCNAVDDQSWSHMVLTSQSGTVQRPSSSGSSPVTSTTTYSYKLTLLAAERCSDCIAGYTWGDENDGDYLDYYNAHFMGYTQTRVTSPDGSVQVHKYYATDGWGLYDTGQVTCYASSPCHNAPWWSRGTALHGHEYETDSYDTDGSTLLGKTTIQYQVTCPPSGISGTPPTAWGNWGGNLVSLLDPGNPVAVCDVQTSQTNTYTYEGANTSWAVPQQTVSYTYDSYGRVSSTTTTSNDGGATGSPTTIVARTLYVQNNNVSTAWNSVTGSYLIDFPAFSDIEPADGSHRYSCIYRGYDGQAYTTGLTSGLVHGNVTSSADHSNCGTAPDFHTSGQLLTTTSYDAWGNTVATTDPDANAGVSGHTGCTVNGTQYTSCTTLDSTYHALPVSVANALNQSSSTGYTTTAAGGFGLWPTSATDANGQTTTTSYDALGRVTSTTLPGETAGQTTATSSYTVWCSGTSAQTPCIEVDSTHRLDGTTTVTTRAFYDGWGQLVETRTPAPGGQDVVQYADYDPSGRRIFLSNKYFVPAYTGGPGAAAFATPDASKAGTSTSYYNLRTTSTTDALSRTSSTTLSVACALPGTANDGACYTLTTVLDPLNDQQTSATDALGRALYAQSYTGTNPYTLYATTTTTYDYLGNVTKIVHPDGASVTSYSYDDSGRKIGMSDPDRGTETYAYDADGNLVQSMDARGAAGTIFAGYDGLDRQLWRNTTNSPSGAYVTYSYDSTANGNQGIGRLTGETFSGGPTGAPSGLYSYLYDGRGQQVQATLTVGGSYTAKGTYNDGGSLLTETYPDGEVVSTSYTEQGWLASLTTQQGTTTTTLLGGVTYGGAGGADGMATGALLGGGTYTYAEGFDLVDRPTELKLTLTSTGSTLFDSQPSYGARGNVVAVNTTLPQGYDVQQFCYDDFNRLTWAGTSGTNPCTNTAVSGSTLTAAQYQQSYAYDKQNRLTAGPLGSYTYGDGAHLHAATSIGTGYTASYDASGNMTCRAPTSGATCAGSTPTGAQLTYDNEGRMTAWQNAPGSTSTSATGYLYDGEGQRVAQQVTQGGTTSVTVYIGNLEEVATSGSTTSTTTYYYAGGERIALAVNGTISYLASDLLGSATVALDAAGHVQAAQLYAPYGTVRYSSGTMPSSYGFTGQRADGATGLDYYGARYYDQLAGQFTSADTDDQGGLNRYAYVKGNPETLTDPTGHRSLDPGDPPTVLKLIWLGVQAAAAIYNAVAGIVGTSPVYPNTSVSQRPPMSQSEFNIDDFPSGEWEINIELPDGTIVRINFKPPDDLSGGTPAIPPRGQGPRGPNPGIVPHRPGHQWRPGPNRWDQRLDHLGPDGVPRNEVCDAICHRNTDGGENGMYDPTSQDLANAACGMSAICHRNLDGGENGPIPLASQARAGSQGSWDWGNWWKWLLPFTLAPAGRSNPAPPVDPVPAGGGGEWGKCASGCM